MTSPTGDDGHWIRRFHQVPESDVRLVCFPHAAGSASYYFPLSQALAPDIEVLAVQYPGRQDRRREPCIDNIAELANRVHAALRTWTGRPFAFFGHSMGAIVAFEVARRLQRDEGTAPAWLFASGRRAPARHRDGDGDVHLRDDAGIVDALRAVGSTDPRILDDAELLAAILPVARSDYRAIENYRYAPGPPLDCPITALVGDADPQATVAEAAAWGEHCTGTFDLRVFPGGHFFLESCRSQIVELISSALKNVYENATNGGNGS